MGRTKEDEFWNCVEDVDGGLKCLFCHYLFKGKVSISRIKFHLSGEPGRGIQSCKMVPDNVKSKVSDAIQESRKRPRTMPNSSSNPSSRQQNDQVETEQTPFEGQAFGHEGVPDMANFFPHAEVDTFTANNVGETGQDQAANASMPFPTANNAAETRQDGGAETFPTTGLVGQNFQINKEKVCECLMNDDISRIGIYGMGGSGKTTLMKHIHNQLEKKHIPVYWITVSQDFGIYRLQTRIAESIQLDLSNEREIFKRAAKLKKTLNEKQKYVLILDDLWDHFDLEDVGIPGDANGCKLILTTRLLDVCWKMCCEETIQVVPLNEDEAWRLFEEKFGAPLPSGVTDTAKQIAMECDGLPLGIITMARSMRGLDDISEWRNGLRKLKESQVRNDEMNEKVFSVLKFSYNRLNDSALQQCFLYCALYPKDHEFEGKQLIEHMIDEEIIREESMQAAFDEGHTIVNRLKRVCLLEESISFYGEKCVMMHDLIRDMAIQIIKEKGGVMVKAGAQLEEIPDCEKWTEDLLKVSLADNNIEKIPSDFSPRCPKLSTLLLSRNFFLRNIPNCFFEQLIGLKVLDLSCTGIEELPNSISDLESLNVLVLSYCRNLRHLPSLSKLRALKKLDLKDCKGVENLPQGIEFLFNLRHLDLRDTGVEKFPVGILLGLLNLQVLMVLSYLKGEELAFLRKLEILICRLDNVAELKTLPSNLNCYTLLVGVLDWDFVRGYMDDDDDNDEIKPYGRNLFINNGYEREHFLSLSCSFPSLFQSIQYVNISCLKEENAAAALPLSLPDSTFSQLKVFKMYGCRPSMKKLFPPGLVSNFQNLELLLVSDCMEMEEIIATEEEHQSHNSIQFTLPKLKRFALYDLPNLKSICRGDIICNSLEDMTIDDCEELNRVPLSLLAPSQFSPLPSLKSFFVYPTEWWERVELVHPNTKDILSPFCESGDWGVLFGR